MRGAGAARFFINFSVQGCSTRLPRFIGGEASITRLPPRANDARQPEWQASRPCILRMRMRAFARGHREMKSDYDRFSLMTVRIIQYWTHKTRLYSAFSRILHLR